MSKKQFLGIIFMAISAFIGGLGLYYISAANNIFDAAIALLVIIGNGFVWFKAFDYYMGRIK